MSLSILPVRSHGRWHDTLRASTGHTSEDATQHELVPRLMSDSYCEHFLPFTSDAELLEEYTSTSGGVRNGKLMEVLDSLGGSIAYKHMLGPVETIGNFASLGFYVVTASVDRQVLNSFCTG